MKQTLQIDITTPLISALGRGDYQASRDHDAPFSQDRGQDRDRYDQPYDDYYRGPRDDYERDPGPDRGRGGPGPDMGHGGSDFDMGRGRPDLDMRRGGPGPDMEHERADFDMRQGGLGPDMERGGSDFDMRRGGPGPDIGRGGPDFYMRRGGPGPDMGRGGPGPGMERDPYQDQPVEEDEPEISTNFPDEEEREVWDGDEFPKDNRRNELHQQGSRGDFGRERREADRYVS